MITSIYSPNQEVPEYLQKHALILHVQKLYRVRPANSTRHNYLGFAQFDLVDTYFYSKWGLLPVFFGLHVVHQVDKGIYIINLWEVWFLLEQCLSSGTVSSLIACLGFISIIDDTVLSILFTVLSKFLTQIVSVLKLLSIHQFKQQFFQLLVKSLHKGCVSEPIFRCCPPNLNIVIFKQLCHFGFKFWPIIALKCLGYLNTPPFL